MLVDLGSRDPSFIDVSNRVRSLLLKIAKAPSSYAAIPLQGSGTFAVEAALTTFVGPMHKVLVCVNGYYAERIVTMLRRHGRSHCVLGGSPKEQIDTVAVQKMLEGDSSITHLCFVHCETTTGLLNPYRALVKSAHERGILSIIDAMSSFGVADIDAQRDQFDILISSGNKCIEAPPGIAFAIVKESLLRRKTTHATTYTLDLYDQWLNFERTGEWRTTPPTHVAQALLAALINLEAEGQGRRLKRYSDICQLLITGMRSMEFEPVLAGDIQFPVCVAFHSAAHVPDANAFLRLYNLLRAEGMVVYAKFHDETASFRIGCIGRIQLSWVDDLLEAVSAFIRQNGRANHQRFFVPATRGVAP